MIVIVFRTRMREGAQLEEAGTRGAFMYELGSEMPGFVSYKDFSAPDGESVSIVEFEDLEKLEAWRNHPKHRETQEWGRRNLFAEYSVQVCEQIRTSRFGHGS